MKHKSERKDHYDTKGSRIQRHLRRLSEGEPEWEQATTGGERTVSLRAYWKGQMECAGIT